MRVSLQPWPSTTPRGGAGQRCRLMSEPAYCPLGTHVAHPVSWTRESLWPPGPIGPVHHPTFGVLLRGESATHSENRPGHVERIARFGRHLAWGRHTAIAESDRVIRPCAETTHREESTGLSFPLGTYYLPYPRSGSEACRTSGGVCTCTDPRPGAASTRSAPPAAGRAPSCDGRLPAHEAGARGARSRRPGQRSLRRSGGHAGRLRRVALRCPRCASRWFREWWIQ